MTKVLEFFKRKEKDLESGIEYEVPDVKMLPWKANDCVPFELSHQFKEIIEGLEFISAQIAEFFNNKGEY